ncbi:hypothetical protein [Pseudomonas sp. 1152_12]|uniref:hypothetical protein n=1 Tax=Pseudomonas sp. 1152_12 TaxID=2604455 RepID=UPI004063DB7F
MSLSALDSRTPPQSSPPPGELRLSASTAQSDLPVEGVKTNAEAELATLLADKHQDDWQWQKLSPETSVGKWLGLFNQAWSTPAMQAWVSAQRFVMPTFRIVGTTLTVTSLVGEKSITTTFTPSDGTGWWPLGRQVIASAAILDPHKKGLNGNPQTQFGPSDIAAFYGVTWPINQTDAEQLKANGFPVKPVAEDPMRSPEIRKLAAREFMDVENENALIKTLLGKVKDKPGDEKIDLSKILQGITPGSSLAIANRSGLKLLQPLMRDPMMAPILSAYRTDSKAKVSLVDRELFISADGKPGSWRNVTARVLAHPHLAPILESAVQHSCKTGNIISSQSTTDVWQMLRFATSSELPATVTVSELASILNWKLNPLPPEPSLGGYARSFLEDRQSPDCLDSDQRLRVRRSAPDTGVPPKLTLLDCSPEPWAGKTLTQIREQADQLISQALTQGAGLRRCEPILAALKDDPTSPTGDVLPSYRKQMILARDLLTVDPELGTRRNHIAGYNLYSVSNTGKTLSEVRTELEQRIAGHNKIPLNQATVLTHALLATSAPEFLVKGAGDVRVGTLELVNLRVQTSLVEGVSQGSSRHMSVAQLSSRALLGEIAAEHKELQAVESAGPIYDWALAQGLVPVTDDYSPWAINVALTAYNQRLDAYNASARGFDNARSNFKTRVEVGEQALESACPGNAAFLDKPILYIEPRSIAIGLLTSRPPGNLFDSLLAANSPHPSINARITGGFSIKDLYLSGVLTPENVKTVKWTLIDPQDRIEFEALKPMLERLKPITTVFDDPFNSATGHFSQLSVLSTRTLMSEMPVEDKIRLEFGDVTVFGAAKFQEVGANVLTQEQAQQKMGPILFVQHALGDKCYEFFPMTKTYVEHPEWVDAMKSPIKFYALASELALPMRKRNHPTLPADIEIKAHLKGLEASDGVTRAMPNSYSSPRTNEIINILQKDKLLVDRDFLLKHAKGTTTSERMQATFDAIDTFIINTLIPFKGNIEEILSGDPRRVLVGAVGLGLEVFGALFVVAGALSKGATAAAKLGNLGRAAISMFNLPSAIGGTTQSLYRLTSMGVRSVGQGVIPKTLGKALTVLRRYAFGANKQTQRIIRRAPSWSARKEATRLLENTGLINTVYGAVDFSQQTPPAESRGSAAIAQI